jgi:hypothetical protein
VRGHIQFFFERARAIEEWHQERTPAGGLTPQELAAGYDRLEAFGFLNSLPHLVANFGLSRHEILSTCTVAECYIELQRIAIENDCAKRYKP